MADSISDEVAYYYDLYPTEEDLMGETSDHADLIHYLMEVLIWFFHGQACAVYENLNFYQTVSYEEKPLAPDIAVIKGMAFRRMRSWRVGTSGPTPQVVFEVASKETWKKDLKEKPVRYAQMGVQEYFAYDPNDPPIGRDSPRLCGWRLDPSTHQMREMSLRPDGSLWSIHLESALVADGRYLRLYDQYGQPRLTRAEAEAESRQAEARRAEMAERRAKAEARRAEIAEKRAEAEAEAKRLLLEKLRSRGIDPDQL